MSHIPARLLEIPPPPKKAGSGRRRSVAHDAAKTYMQEFKNPNLTPKKAVRNILLMPIGCLILACVLVQPDMFQPRRRCGNARIPENDWKERELMNPRALSSKERESRRRLTITSADDGGFDGLNAKPSKTPRASNAKQQTFAQEQSPLFKLPREIRDVIYRYVLADRTLHIVHRQKNRLGHVQCQHDGEPYPPVEPYAEHDRDLIGRPFPEPSISSPPPPPPADRSRWPLHNHASCYGNENYLLRGPAPSGVPGLHVGRSSGSLLCLPLSCRLIYTETMPLLYSGNTFSFRHLFGLLDFALTTLEPRFNTIRSLHINQDVSFPFLHTGSPTSECDPPFDKFFWAAIWELVASMKGLRTLRLEVQGANSVPMFLCYYDLVEQFFAPLNKIDRGRVTTFEVKVPWRKDAVEGLIEHNGKHDERRKLIDGPGNAYVVRYWDEHDDRWLEWERRKMPMCNLGAM